MVDACKIRRRPRRWRRRRRRRCSLTRRSRFQRGGSGCGGWGTCSAGSSGSGCRLHGGYMVVTWRLRGSSGSGRRLHFGYIMVTWRLHGSSGSGCRLLPLPRSGRHVVAVARKLPTHCSLAEFVTHASRMRYTYVHVRTCRMCVTYTLRIRSTRDICAPRRSCATRWRRAHDGYMTVT